MFGHYGWPGFGYYADPYGYAEVPGTPSRFVQATPIPMRTAIRMVRRRLRLRGSLRLCRSLYGYGYGYADPTATPTATTFRVPGRGDGRLRAGRSVDVRRSRRRCSTAMAAMAAMDATAAPVATARGTSKAMANPRHSPQTPSRRTNQRLWGIRTAYRAYGYGGVLPEGSSRFNAGCPLPVNVGIGDDESVSGYEGYVPTPRM